MSNVAGYPIVLDVTARPIVIVGGGAVALRKVQVLLASGATMLRVVSPTFHPEMPTQVQRIAEPYQAEHLSGASLVFAATDSADVNDAVVSDAHKIGALACRADAADDEDEAATGDFTTPALLRDGPLLITVSTGGSPALSAMIRDSLAKAIDPRWSRMAAAMQTLRPLIRRNAGPARRRELLRELCTEPAMSQLNSGGIDALRIWIAARFPEMNV